MNEKPVFEGMSKEILQSLFETVPGEITVIDSDDKVVGWNKHSDRLFFRPLTSMGADFHDCHPEKSLALVEKIVGEMKAGTREKARFWIDLTVDKAAGTKHKVLIEFYALRDPQGKYLGCMEFTRDVDDIMRLEGERRLIDER
jgi:PAS domain S-box-containing protein